MLRLSKTNQIIIGLIIAAVVFITRGDHFASLNHLPSASLAAFFVLGFYLQGRWPFVALLLLCFGVDYYSITAAGVNSFCVTPAYGFLIPAYGVLWLAGRWFSQRYQFSAKALAPLLGSVLSAAVVSELFSSGGFYFLGGRFEHPTLSVFAERLMKYFPQQLEGIGFWLAVTFIAHVVIVYAKGTTNQVNA